MKIVILTNSCKGLYSFRRELIDTLIEKRYEVCAYTPINGCEQELEWIGCQVKKLPVDRRGINLIKDIALFLNIMQLLYREKSDIVITYTIKPNVYGGFACRLLKIPYAANITGLGTAFQKEGLLKSLVTVMYKIGLKKAKTVFFENIENQQIFIDNNIIKKGQACLLNGAGVNLEHYRVTEYPTDTNTTRFLFIGRVMREKGIDELFEAMRRLQQDGVNCALDILGSYEEDYEAIIKQYEIEGWLHYHGYQEDVRPFIANCHCFVLPSWHEGMANTNLECAASGRPVITSNIHGCLEAVEDGVSGYLCERRNADSLYDAMKKFTELSFEQRQNMGLAGRKQMEDAFDKKKVVERTLIKLFEENDITQKYL